MPVSVKHSKQKGKCWHFLYQPNLEILDQNNLHPALWLVLGIQCPTIVVPAITTSRSDSAVSELLIEMSLYLRCCTSWPLPSWLKKDRICCSSSLKKMYVLKWSHNNTESVPLNLLRPSTSHYETNYFRNMYVSLWEPTRKVNAYHCCSTLGLFFPLLGGTGIPHVMPGAHFWELFITQTVHQLEMNRINVWERITGAVVMGEQGYGKCGRQPFSRTWWVSRLTSTWSGIVWLVGCGVRAAIEEARHMKISISYPLPAVPPWPVDPSQWSHIRGDHTSNMLKAGSTYILLQ